MKRSLFYILLAFSLGLLSAPVVEEIPASKSSLSASFTSSDGTLFVNEHYKVEWDNAQSLLFHYSWNDDNWAIFKTPLSPPGIAWNELRYYAEDKLGNKEAEQKINLYLDTKAPKVTVVWKNLPKSWDDVPIAKSTNEIMIKPSDEESGLESLYVSLDGGAFLRAENTKEWTHQTKDEGRHQLVVYAVDQVKNASKQTKIEWLIDSTPPTLSFVTNPEIIKNAEVSICARKTKIELTSKDSVTETKDILWRKKGTENWVITNRILDIEKNFPFDRKIDLEFKAIDFSGNETVVQNFSCIIDMIAPETIIRIQR